MQRKKLKTGYIYFIVILTILAGSLIALSFAKREVTVTKDSDEESFDYDDVTNLPDQQKYDQPPPQGGGEPPQGGGEPPQTTPKDYSFSGTVKCEAKLLDSQGTALQAIELAFYKYNPKGNVEVDKLSLHFAWEFKVGSNIKASSIQLHLIGRLKTFWYSTEDPYQYGTLDSGKVLEAWGYNLKGWYDKEWSITDPALKWREPKEDEYVIWVTPNDFIIRWEAIVETDTGEKKTITGSFGIGIYLIWTPDDTIVTPDPSTPDLPETYPDPYDYMNNYDYWYGDSLYQCVIALP